MFRKLTADVGSAWGDVFAVATATLDARGYSEYCTTTISFSPSYDLDKAVVLRIGSQEITIRSSEPVSLTITGTYELETFEHLFADLSILLRKARQEMDRAGGIK